MAIENGVGQKWYNRFTLSLDGERDKIIINIKFMPAGSNNCDHVPIVFPCRQKKIITICYHCGLKRIISESGKVEIVKYSDNVDSVRFINEEEAK